METRLNRNEIVRRLQNEYERLQVLLTDFTADQMLTPGVVGDWSVKDVIAHLMHWARFPVKELVYALHGEDSSSLHDPRGDDEVNGEVVAASRSQSLEEVLANFAQAYIELVHTVESLPDEAFEPGGQFETRLGDTVSQTLNNNTWDHWALHRAQIQRWQVTGETQ